MTAARLLQSITSWGLDLSVVDGALVVKGKPSRNVQMLIGLYRQALIDALQGHDRPLADAHPRVQLLAMGFVEWRRPDGTRQWVHNDGDDAGDRILIGEIRFEDARAEQAGRTRQARTLLGREGFIRHKETRL